MNLYDNDATLINERFVLDQYNAPLGFINLYDINRSDQSEIQNLDFWKDSFAALGKMGKKSFKVLDRGVERRKKALADDLELTGKYVKQNGNFIGSDLYASIASGTGQLLNHGVDKSKLLTPK